MIREFVRVPTMDIGKWLRRIRLEQYEAAFCENKIDGEVLAQLTAEDLKDIGVAIVGDRRKMLTAIAALSAPPAAAPVGTIPAAPEPAPCVAERRQLTVMFCDLVGSTSMSARLDPEDMRAIIGVYHRCCAERIAYCGGFVAKYMGDGVLAYFGYPQAHEHDAERAVSRARDCRGRAETRDRGRHAAARPNRDRDRAGRRRRPRWIRGGARTRCRRRDAEPRGASSRDRRTG